MTNEPLDEPPLRLVAEWKKRGLPEAARRVLAIGETAEATRLSDEARDKTAGGEPLP